jgi:hypothetical protein
MKLNRRQLRRLINEALEDAMIYPTSGESGEEVLKQSNRAFQIVRMIVIDAGFNPTKLLNTAMSSGASNIAKVLYSGEHVADVTVYGDVYVPQQAPMSPEPRAVYNAILSAISGKEKSALHAEYGY